MEKMDINDRYQKFRNSLISDTYQWIMGNGGIVYLKDAEVTLGFTSVRNGNDILGAVYGKSLVASADEPDKVTFCYRTPEWCESNSDYIDIDEDSAEYEVDLNELSSDELYNVLKIITL